jgi:ribosomal protein L37AE/L43A
MQFQENKTQKTKCPVCGKEVVKRTTRGKPNYCSRICASQLNYAKRYEGSLSGKVDRPTLLEKTKL